jgi:GT2 family glycosyltransferase
MINTGADSATNCPATIADSLGRFSSALDCEISVVVPTFNRQDELRRLLESLWRQTLSRSQFEVIVASDGSTDGTVEMVRQLQGRQWNLKLLQLTNGGPATARNAGAQAAQGCYVAFTDDDCVATPDWLQEMLEAFQRTGAIGLQGRTTTDRLARTPLTHQIEVLSHWPAAVPTCNAAYRKEVFQRVGGFDVGFRFAHNEDADLAWRVEDFGGITFAPDMHVIHPPRRDNFWKRARWVRFLESDFYLYYKNPVKYRKYISPSPWWTIYWKFFVMDQIELVKLCLKCLQTPFRPYHFVTGIGLVLARSFNLIRFLPEFWKAQARYRLKFSKCQ